MAFTLRVMAQRQSGSMSPIETAPPRIQSSNNSITGVEQIESPDDSQQVTSPSKKAPNQWADTLPSYNCQTLQLLPETALGFLLL